MSQFYYNGKYVGSASSKTVFYGTCTGQAANQIKAVVVDSSQGFALEAGIILLVKFDENNTYSATADNPVKLNVNSTGAKNIYYGASNAPTGTNTTPFGRTGYVNQYYYDGTNWIWSGSSADNNTTYSNMSANELTTGTVTTGRTISAKVLTDWITSKLSGLVSDDPTFTEASTRANIASGESFATILGKIKKFFTDLKTVAFTGAYSDLSGTPNLTNVAYKNVDNSFTSNQTINRNDGTTSNVGSSYIMLGNNIPSGTAKNSRGVLRLFGNGDKYAQIFDDGALTSNRNLKIPDKSGTIALTSDISKAVFYGTCTEQAANQTKAVVVDSSQGFALADGIILFVKFDANNTYSATAEAPVKLNVNSTGAKNVQYGNSTAPTGTNTTAFGRANYINQYCYDGTSWVWTGSSSDSNTTYSNMSANELTTGTATTARSISAKVLKDWNTAANTTYSNTTSGLSATKVQGAIDELSTEKQDKTDSSLNTTAKTVVGAVNELKSGLNNLTSHVGNLTSQVVGAEVSVTGDGVKTYSTLISELMTKITAANININVADAYLGANGCICRFSQYRLFVGYAMVYGGIAIQEFNLSAGGLGFYNITANGITIENLSNTAAPNGYVLAMHGRL